MSQKASRVLFACTMNSIRSPMAAALARRRFAGQIVADSCGVHDGYLDPFMVQVMEDWGVNLSDHVPKSFENLDVSQFDLIITLTALAKDMAGRRIGKNGPMIEFWDTPNPTDEMFGPRDLRVLAYSQCRDFLDQKIKARFS